jgi:hypothetical protein
VQLVLWRCNILLFSLFCIYASTPDAWAKKATAPEDEIMVKDYKWGSGGPGTVGIIKEITLENKGKISYKNIEIEANLYTRTEVPLGSLRSTIHDVLPGESTKTFYNVNFGLMHSDLQNIVLRIVRAETLETVFSARPSDLIIVKNWEWSGGQYATEGILKEITLENKSETNYQNIEIQLEYFSPSGEKLGPTTAIIHDILPAKAEKKFYGINVGFRQPQIKKTLITVTDASRAPVRKPRIAKTGTPIEKPNKKASTKVGAVGESKNKIEGKSAPASSNVINPSTKGSAKGKELAVEPPREGEANTIEAPKEQPIHEEGQEEEEEPIPQDDIIVKDFKWGSGIAGTIGVVRELTLENQGDTTYSNIKLRINFYARSVRRLLGSNEVTIRDTLPANSEKTFRDIKAGFLNFLPEDIEIKVVGALVVK